MGTELVLGIPGHWKDRSDIITSIAGANGPGKKVSYLAAGPLIMDMESKKGFHFEVYDRDPALVRAFQAAGQGKLSDKLLAAIDQHTFTVYVVTDEQGLEVARRLLKLGAFLLDAGGLAVKVESTGVAHSPERWRYRAASPSTLSVYEAFSILVGSKEFTYSCGMRTFGLPDASVTARLSSGDAAEVLTAFNHWQLLEMPTLKKGDEFSTAAQEPTFHVQRLPYGYGEDELLNNPHGRWHLELAGLRPAMPPEFETKGEPLFMALPADDPEVRESVKRARSTIDYFLRHASCPYEYGKCLFKTKLVAGDHSAYLWLSFAEEQGDSLVGRFFELPPELSGYRVGQTLKVRREDVFDWAILKSGTLIGGYSMRLKRAKVKPELQRAWDLFSGTISYASLDEIVP